MKQFIRKIIALSMLFLLALPSLFQYAHTLAHDCQHELVQVCTSSHTESHFDAAQKQDDPTSVQQALNIEICQLCHLQWQTQTIQTVNSIESDLTASVNCPVQPTIQSKITQLISLKSSRAPPVL